MDEYEFTDSDYGEFMDYVSGSDFVFTSNSSKALKALKRIAQTEGLAQKAADEFDALEAKLDYDLKHDLDLFRNDIKRVVGMEIASRYYYQKGAVIQSMKGDKVLDEAVRILDDGKRYASLLQGPGKKP